MILLSPFLLLVSLVVVSAQDHRAGVARERESLIPSVWTERQGAADRQLSDHQRPLWLVEKLPRPGVPGGVSHHWGLSWPAGGHGGTKINAIEERSVARRSPDWMLESALASSVQTCGSELANMIEDLCHGRRRRNVRAAGELRPRSSRHGGSTYTR